MTSSANQETEDPRDASDPELIERAVARDEEAARTLFDRYARECHERVQRALRPEMQRRLGSSDVVQEAFLAAFLDLARFEAQDDDAFRRWLGTILRNRLQDEIRRMSAGRRDVRRDLPLRDPPPARGDTPSRMLMRQEEALALHLAMEKLLVDQRTALTLTLWEGLSHEEAGRQLGRSPEAVRKLCARGVVRLGDFLRGPGRGNGERGDGSAR